MASINLSNDKIQSINNEITSLDSVLINSYIPSLNDVISQIKSNVLNEQVNQILNSISSQINTIGSELQVDLPKLEQFLDNQMTEYTTSESDAEAKVNVALNKMQLFASSKSTLNTVTSNVFSGKSVNSSNNGTPLSTRQQSASYSSDRSGLGGKIATDRSNLGSKITSGAVTGAMVGGTSGAMIGAISPVATNAAKYGLSALGQSMSDVSSWLDNMY